MIVQGDPQRNFVRMVTNDDRSQWRSGAPGPHASRRQGAENGSITTAPADVILGQNWSIWVPARRQWLHARVLREQSGKVTLRYDGSYGITAGHDEVQADAQSMLSSPNLFRYDEA